MKSKNVKRILRILYGGLAVVFMVFAGREVMLDGAALEALASSGAGIVLAFSAITGAG